MIYENERKNSEDFDTLMIEENPEKLKKELGNYIKHCEYKFSSKTKTIFQHQN